jgi:Flp pilus assembly protein TadG
VTPNERPTRRRTRSRGVAALEFALSLTFLVPLAGAAVDYGYYFYIGSSAEEAARAGLREAILAYQAAAGPTTACTGGAGAAAAAIVRTDGEAAGTGEAFQVMNQAPLYMAGNTQVQLTCDADPVAPSWHITVRVDFSPALGLVTPFMPAGTPGKIRYRTTLHGN